MVSVRCQTSLPVLSRQDSAALTDVVPDCRRACPLSVKEPLPTGLSSCRMTADCRLAVVVGEAGRAAAEARAHAGGEADAIPARRALLEVAVG